MEITGFPTSADIYLEVDGKKVAVVQSYSSKASKTSQSVEAFGESEPVTTTSATSPGSSASPTAGSFTAAASGVPSPRRANSTPWWRRR